MRNDAERCRTMRNDAGRCDVGPFNYFKVLSIARIWVKSKEQMQLFTDSLYSLPLTCVCRSGSGLKSSEVGLADAPDGKSVFCWRRKTMFLSAFALWEAFLEASWAWDETGKFPRWLWLWLCPIYLSDVQYRFHSPHARVVSVHVWSAWVRNNTSVRNTMQHVRCMPTHKCKKVCVYCMYKCKAYKQWQNFMFWVHRSEKCHITRIYLYLYHRFQSPSLHTLVLAILLT